MVDVTQLVRQTWHLLASMLGDDAACYLSNAEEVPLYRDRRALAVNAHRITIPGRHVISVNIEQESLANIVRGAIQARFFL